MKRRIVNALLGLLGLTAVGSGAWYLVLRPRPTRLSVTKRVGDDTVVVNQMQPTWLRTPVLDQRGHPMRADTAVRYRWLAGDSIPLSQQGRVRCAKRGDAVVRATFQRLRKRFVLRCRPAAWIRAVSWLDLVVGDSARSLPFAVYAPDGRPVTELRGTLTVPNASVVNLEGATVRPERSGATVAVLDVGDLEARIPIMVYQPVTSFVQPSHRLTLMAMRVSLARGDTIRTPLPKAAFWVTYLPANPDVAPPTIELVGAGSCTTGDGIRARRIETGEYAKYCYTGNDTEMMIAHGVDGAERVNGVVAIRVMW